MSQPPSRKKEVDGLGTDLKFQDASVLSIVLRNSHLHIEIEVTSRSRSTVWFFLSVPAHTLVGTKYVYHRSVLEACIVSRVSETVSIACYVYRAANEGFLY